MLILVGTQRHRKQHAPLNLLDYPGTLASGSELHLSILALGLSIVLCQFLEVGQEGFRSTSGERSTLCCHPLSATRKAVFPWYKQVPCPHPESWFYNDVYIIFQEIFEMYPEICQPMNKKPQSLHSELVNKSCRRRVE